MAKIHKRMQKYITLINILIMTSCILYQMGKQCQTQQRSRSYSLLKLILVVSRLE